MLKLASRAHHSGIARVHRVLVALMLLVLAGGVLAGPAAPEAAAQGACAENGCVDVVEVQGLIDPIVADQITTAVDAAEASAGDVLAVVLQLNSEGTVLGPEDFEALVRRVARSSVPVSVWVGPSGSQALGGAAELALVSSELTLALGSDIGAVGRQRTDATEFPDVLSGPRSQLADGVLDAEAAEAAGIARVAPIALEHVANLPGIESDEVDLPDGGVALQPRATARFSSLGLLSELMHTVASPSVAYLMFVIGLGLLLFEFFTAGIGIAGVTGAGCLVLGSYGIATLPHSGWGLGLMLFAAFGFAVDIQVGVPRVWTGIALASFVVGSWFLFTEFRPGWPALIAGVVGMSSAMVSGMPAMVRTRFGTPTIGRDWMIGELGDVATDVDPEGVVVVRGAQWRARTNRATPIAEGQRARVVAIDGLLLEVEPEEGGARDYREMRGRRGDADATSEADAPDVPGEGSERAPEGD